MKHTLISGFTEVDHDRIEGYTAEEIIAGFNALMRWFNAPSMDNRNAARRIAKACIRARKARRDGASVRRAA